MKRQLTQIALLLPLTSSLIGCASMHTINEPVVAQGSPTLISAAQHEALWSEVLAELFPVQAQAEPAQQGMPSLVAGDWLAMRCAIVGDYWDLNKNNDAPAYAEAPESWYLLD